MRLAPSVAGSSVLLALMASACASRTDPQANAPSHDPQGVVVPAQVPVIGGWDVYPVPTTAALPPVPRQLTIPAIVPGELQTGDMAVPEDHGRVADHYIMQLTAGQPVTFVARGGGQASGGAIDLMLFLYRNRNVVMSDDDSASDGSALNPRIVFTPTESGTYVLRVTSYGGDFRQGTYTLQAYNGALDSQL